MSDVKLSDKSLSDKEYDHMLRISSAEMEELHENGKVDIVQTSGSERMIIRVVFEGAAKSDSEESVTTELVDNSGMRQPPASAASAARKVLAWKKKHGREVKGMTPVGWARARQLATGKPVPMATVKKMSAFNRHRQNYMKARAKQKAEGGNPWEYAAIVAWLGWGGTAAIDWARKTSAANDSLEASDAKRSSPKGKGAKTPAEPSERIKGSKKNKKGSAKNTRGSIQISASAVSALKEKMSAHNEKHGSKKGKKVTLGMLKAVWRRGAGAFSSTHRPNMSRAGWAMARVNAFLHLVRTGSPKNSKYTTDNDLLPAGHPKKSNSDTYCQETEFSTFADADFDQVPFMNQTTMTDLYHIRPDANVVDMSLEDKASLFEKATSGSDGEKRGLIITFDLSSSYRVTNNRLYSAAGQRRGLDTWTKPYPKPILRNHDTNTDPIGRIVDVQWVSNDEEAMKFFPNLTEFMSFKRILDSENPKKIYKEMLRRGLLTNDGWPGTGKLVAKARISDPDAIQKFLDGRYLTFSAGSHTDSYSCGICGSDWATGDVCEHPPGSMSDEGKPAIYFTGTFRGREASVVTVPGNSTSMLTSMEFGDSVDLAPTHIEALKFDESNILITDASIDTGVDMAKATNDATVATLDLEAVLNQLLADEDALALLKAALADEEITDATNEDGQVEGSVQVPEAAEDNEEEEEVNEKEEVITEDSQEDSEDTLVEETSTLTEDAAETDTVEVEDAAEVDAADAEVVEEAVASDAEVETEQTIEDADVDWYLLDAALVAEVGDAKLSAEARRELPASDFCGPERSFPVPDCAHVTAARRLIGRAKLSESQKERVLSCVDRKAKKLGCDSNKEDSSCGSCSCSDNLQEKLDALNNDYKSSLEIIAQLKGEIASLKESSVVLDKEEELSHDDSKTVTSVVDIKPVEDESVSSSSTLTDSLAKLGAYEKKIVSRYKELRDEKGDLAANRFLSTKIARGHLPRTFDITPHIQENE